MTEEMITGRNPVLEAIKSGRSIHKLWVVEGEKHGSILQIMALAKESGIVTQFVPRRRIEEMAQNKAHQGVIAFVACKAYVEVEDILDAANKRGESPFIIILDEIKDPHNLGAILRTADAVGAHGVIIPQRRAVGLTGVVAKASAGAVEYVPVAQVVNLARVLEQLKKEGLWIFGADMKGEETFYDANLSGAIGLVIGAEGAGISRLIKEKCDVLVNIPMTGQISSLNASVAASILMYEVFKQRNGAKM